MREKAYGLEEFAGAVGTRVCDDCDQRLDFADARDDSLRAH